MILKNIKFTILVGPRERTKVNMHFGLFRKWSYLLPQGTSDHVKLANVTHPFLMLRLAVLINLMSRCFQAKRFKTMIKF